MIIFQGRFISGMNNEDTKRDLVKAIEKALESHKVVDVSIISQDESVSAKIFSSQDFPTAEAPRGWGT